jgi:adenylate cyclase
VLESSMRKAGNRVRVTAQVIDSTNGGHIWADRFDRDLTDIFDVQDELTREIVSALELTLNAGDRDRLAHKRMVDIEAYNLFLRGREHTCLHSRQGNIAAREILARAVEITPGFAAAHARIAFTHVIDYANGWAEDLENSLRVGLELARRAVEMDEGEPQSHFSLSVALLWSREHTPALAACYGHLGKLEESRAAWANTQRINPEFSLERRRRVLPFKDPADFELRIEGLRMAGIVD